MGSDASSFGRQGDVGEALVGEESSEDFEQVVGVIVPFQAELVVTHHHGCCGRRQVHGGVATCPAPAPYPAPSFSFSCWPTKSRD